MDSTPRVTLPFPAQRVASIVGSAPTVVFVHAHPDDEAIFTGATMRRIADRGGRVVLVMATSGEEGESRVGGRSRIARRRERELDASCAALGVARLVRLGRRDSGMPGSAANVHPAALAVADVPTLARRVARVVAQESAAAVVHDDPAGIYGHPDHRTAHRVGALAARLGDVAGYEVSVDRDAAASAGHVVAAAAASAGTSATFGRRAADLGVTLLADSRELLAKRTAMAAHASQMDLAALDPTEFATAYRAEWFTRTRGAAVLESLAGRADAGTDRRVVVTV